jgi:hypothetical protein
MRSQNRLLSASPPRRPPMRIPPPDESAQVVQVVQVIQVVQAVQVAPSRPKSPQVAPSRPGDGRREVFGRLAAVAAGKC